MCPISTPRSPGRRGCPSRRAACAKSGPISCRRAEAERMDARRAVEQAARDSYGRLLAFLAARSRDVAAAEDALGDAFRAALEAWPRTGVPEKPEAWLLTAARRRLTDGARHARVQADSVPTLLAAAEEAQALASTETLFPDERLALLFICAHPAINAAARTPLMLQTVLGLDAARIASAFLVQPAAMGQRLSRAKAKIRDAGIAFAVPEASELGRLLLRLLPGEPEAQGLLALMLHCEARRAARRSASGEYVPLSEQDTALWSEPLIAQAQELLIAAERAGRIGRFQLEAAIQSMHARRAWAGSTDWEAVALLYEGLVRLAPTIGALVGRAAAIAEARDAATGWALLQAIPAEAVLSYQPYWALAAHLLQRLGRADEAAAAYSRAIGLCEDSAMRAFLTRQRERARG